MDKFELEEYLLRTIKKVAKCTYCKEWYLFRDNCEICEDLSYFEPVDSVGINMAEKVREIVKKEIEITNGNRDNKENNSDGLQK